MSLKNIMNSEPVSSSTKWQFKDDVGGFAQDSSTLSMEFPLVRAKPSIF